MRASTLWSMVLVLGMGWAAQGQAEIAGATFSPAGNKACRTIQGGTPAGKTFNNVSWSQCQTNCKNLGVFCAAVEYQLFANGGTRCKVLNQPSRGTGAASGGISCWQYGIEVQ